MVAKKGLLLSLLLAGCSQAGGLPTPGTDAKPVPTAKMTQSIISGQGEIRLLPMEGGFYGIVAEDGRHWLPLGLPPEFRRPGLKVRFSGEPKPEVLTIQQWGTPLRITEISPLPGQQPGGRDGTH
ncbi:hypothetical protein [Gallaecimonas sp. GXIMD4217]|uniref:hypothetical protein n=1 Tax=Gallaecimonas sp. GXIMD4217 TaxID=3131927 RepID=UPI00311AF4B7